LQTIYCNSNLILLWSNLQAAKLHVRMPYTMCMH